jgi:hypothetical protein
MLDWVGGESRGERRYGAQLMLPPGLTAKMSRGKISEFNMLIARNEGP